MQTLRAYVYCRVSTEEQSREDHYSLHNQEVRARDYAKAKGWVIVKVKKNVGSGKNTSRPGFQDLLTAIKKREIDLVIVYRLDRLSRNVGDIYDTIELMKANDVDFASITEGFDTTTAMGRAMLGFAAVLAQLTREMIAENVKDGLLRRAESGKWN
ncbi:MAG TPA: recombinase family protein, partial [Armatimonadota bacterium]|nr:recombinase family protein [Armatimonadota bacterium]